MQCTSQISIQLNFPTLLCIVSVPNSVCHFDKPVFRKYIFKAVSTSSVRPGKPTRDSHVRLSKPISVSYVSQSKPISDINVRPSKPVSASSVRQGKPISDSNFCPGTPVSASFVRQDKLICDSDVCSSEPVTTSKFVKVNRLVVVMFV